MARKVRIDMTGVRHGRLVGIDYSHSHSGHAHWLFQCDCGDEVVINGAAVRSGKTASCGCLHSEICAARLLKHGRRAKQRHDATYRAWQEINDACRNPASARYPGCGAIGIAVCDAWRSDFENFLRDMGERPADMILARRDDMADFSPGNCLWVGNRSRSARAEAGWKKRHAPDGSVRATA